MFLLWSVSAIAAASARGVWRCLILLPAALGLAYTIYCLYAVFRPNAPEMPQWPLGIMVVGMLLLPVAACLAAVGITLSRARG